MKRYEMVAWGGEGFMGASEEGDWVEAEVAQKLYDTLVIVLAEMEHNPILEEDIEQALVRADLGYNY